MARGRIFMWRLLTVFAAWQVLATASSCIANAATKEEVDRCRATEQRAERLACFNALKQNKSVKPEAAEPAKPESTSSTKSQDGAPAKTGEPATTNAAPPFARPDGSATTSTINRFNTLSGSPICVDRDGLAAVLTAGLLTSDPTQAVLPGCQMLPSDAKVEILERYPGVYPFIRMIKVKVTSPTKPDLTVGITVEVAPVTNEGSSLKAPH